MFIRMFTGQYYFATLHNDKSQANRLKHHALRLLGFPRIDLKVLFLGKEARI